MADGGPPTGPCGFPASPDVVVLRGFSPEIILNRVNTSHFIPCPGAAADAASRRALGPPRQADEDRGFGVLLHRPSIHRYGTSDPADFRHFACIRLQSPHSYRGSC